MYRLPRVFTAFTLVLLFLVLATPRHAQAAEPAGWGRATLSWTSAPHANSYNLYFKEAGKKMYTHSARDLPGNSTSFTVDYLKKGMTYWYSVAALDASGKEYWWSSAKKFWAGSTVSVATKPSVGGLPTPSMPHTTKMDQGGSATASWRSQANVEFYNLYYRESGQKGYTHAVPHIPASGTSLTINGLKKDVGYYYNVAAYYDGQEHWMGEKVLVWPVEVVFINNPSYAPMLEPQPQVTLPPPVTGASRDPFATDSLDVLPPPVTQAPKY